MKINLPKAKCDLLDNYEKPYLGNNVPVLALGFYIFFLPVFVVLVCVGALMTITGISGTSGD